MGRGLAIALLASLALNVFAIGVFSGRFLAPDRLPHHGIAAGPPGLANPMRMIRFAHALPADSREAFRTAIRANIPKLREQRKEMAALRRAYAEALGAETWDRAAVEAAHKNLQDAHEHHRALVNDVFLDAFERLDPDERALLMQHANERRAKRRRRFREPPPD